MRRLSNEETDEQQLVRGRAHADCRKLYGGRSGIEFNENLEDQEVSLYFGT